jgi:hypothetical protein
MELPLIKFWNYIFSKILTESWELFLTLFSTHTPDPIEPVVSDFWNKRRKKHVAMKEIRK